MADAPAPETMRFREFAAHLGCRPGYVTQLRKAGRLVLTEDEKAVRVAESLALIQDTRDPSKAGVALRHAQARAAAGGAAGAGGAGQGKQAAPPATAGDDDDAPASFVPNDPHAKRRAKALADKAEADARKALRDEKIELGELLQASEVTAMVTEAITTFRTSLENLPGQVAPAMAAADSEEQVRVVLAEALEVRLADLSRAFAQIGRAQ